jgi:hypothetical protein
LAQLDIGTEDIKKIRVAVEREKGKSSVDVRFIDYKVQSREFKSVGAPVQTSSRRWWWYTIAAIVLVAVLVFGVRFWLARRAK